MSRSSPRPLFDAHFHVVDPRFPLVPSHGFAPDPFTCDDYLALAEPLGVVGGAVVSGSFQAFDHGYLLDALHRLGPSFVGVVQLPADAPDELVVRLDAAGVRAVRINLRRGASSGVGDLEALARRVHHLAGWHLELYVDALELPALTGVLTRLPCVVIDHLGLSAAGLPALRRLVAHGLLVKASGFGRVEFDVAAALELLADENPGALLFGTDLPSTRAARPFEPTDVDLVVDALGPERARRALWENAVQLYRPSA